MHPKLASGLSVIIYIFICLLIQGIFKIEVIGHILYYVGVLVLGCAVYKYFADRYDGDGNV